MDRCPSCQAPINTNGKFCVECGYNLLAASNTAMQATTLRKSKFRSPLLESSIFDESSTVKKHSILMAASYCFWIFTAIFVIIGAKVILDNYSKDLIKAILDGSFLIVLGLFCFIIPGTLNIIISIEDNLANLLKHTKPDKLD